MKIGVTERGDASVDLSWTNKLSKVDGAVLITKDITDDFIDAVIENADKIIVHATCTGFGTTVLEPNVPPYMHQIEQANKLFLSGFPREKIVIRIDPIIPTEKGIKRAEAVIDYAVANGFKRIRISVIDMYPHARQRFIDAGLPLPYGDNFTASDKQFKDVDDMLRREMLKYDGIRIECCAEPKLMSPIHLGCISKYDTRLLNIPDSEVDKEEFHKQRKNCLCIAGKTELLTCNHRCKHGCLYCYWRD